MASRLAEFGIQFDQIIMRITYKHEDILSVELLREVSHKDIQLIVEVQENCDESPDSRGNVLEVLDARIY